MKTDAMNLLNPSVQADAFGSIRISIASPEDVLKWSNGEIKKPETINYRTYKPERDGLFCARIFGPTRDYECLCGRYKRMKFKGVVCEKCGVEVTLSRVRRERMGHIELASPVAHIWFWKSLPSRISLLLDKSLRDLEAVLYFDKHIVTEPGITPLEMGQLLDDGELYEMQDEYGADSFSAGIGAEAIHDMLANIDLEQLQVDLREEIAVSTGLKPRRLARRLKIVESLLHSGNRPEWMIMTRIPVMPPELRPLVPLDGGRFATSDLNDLYRRVINRNNRLRRLMELRAPDIIVRNEKRMLQEAVDALFDNGRRGRVILGTNKRPLKSLADMLKGKQGRFRQNLLGKRVDYSGRSVIVVGPELKLHQCGLPKKMALELFKPMVFGRLDAKGLSGTIKQSKRLVEQERPEVWDILDEVIREHPIMLNRAPTLHRLGIQAFEPVLIEGKAIQLHPLVCAAFNADFDGDQMAVHVPLSLEAQLEARVLMMSTNNVLHPANGEPIIVPSLDIVLGLYYMSLALEGQEGQGTGPYLDAEEVEHAVLNGVLNIHTKISVRISSFDAEGNPTSELVDTTPGRLRLWELVPRRPELPFSIVNRVLTKKEIAQVIDVIYRHCGQKETVVFCDRAMNTGFVEAFKAGISFGKDDIVVPKGKSERIEKARTVVAGLEGQYKEGMITRAEKFNKVIDVWAKTSNEVAEEMMKEISASRFDDGKELPLNSVYMMFRSGARGSAAQMRQLGGMRGLMAKPSGEIIESPIISNFKEGLSVLEYFTSTHGARKGLADTALKTANSGYLTRRLVDVAQDCIINEEDCGTEEGVEVSAITESGEEIVSLGYRVLGRYVLEDVRSVDSGELVIAAGHMVEELHLPLIQKSGVASIKIRSVITCKCAVGVCASCYGRDLARGTAVNIGEAVGVVAAQSIGEPGTQLTLRTFHIGGAANVVSGNTAEAIGKGKVKYLNLEIIENHEGGRVVVSRNGRVLVMSGKKEVSNHRIPYGARILAEDGKNVERGQILAQWDPYARPIIAEVGGKVLFEDLVEGISVNQTVDESTGVSQAIVADWTTHARAKSLQPALVVAGADGQVQSLPRERESRYLLSQGAVIGVDNGEEVEAGHVLARLPLGGAQTRDITGGLPRVAELFEARRPKDHAILSEISGRIEFGKDYKNKRRVIVRPEDGGEPVEYMIPKGKHLAVEVGDFVEKGEYLLDGNPAPHDILAIRGERALASYLVDEVQAVYRMQGVNINDKHIEVIVRQMLQKVEIVDIGDTSLLEGEYVDRVDFNEVNRRIEQEGGKPASSVPVLLGITKASLQTRSFVSAASFQETTRVLSDAAIQGRVDNLEGLKENVIVGRLIPAGTGASLRRLRSVAVQRDRLIIEAQEEQERLRHSSQALPEEATIAGN